MQLTYGITTAKGRARVVAIVEAALPNATVEQALTRSRQSEPSVRVTRFSGDAASTKGPFAVLVSALTFQVDVVGPAGHATDEAFDKLVAAFAGEGLAVDIGAEAQIENSVNLFGSSMFVTLGPDDVQ